MSAQIQQRTLAAREVITGMATNRAKPEQPIRHPPARLESCRLQLLVPGNYSRSISVTKCDIMKFPAVDLAYCGLRTNVTLLFRPHPLSKHFK